MYEITDIVLYPRALTSILHFSANEN